MRIVPEGQAAMADSMAGVSSVELDPPAVGVQTDPDAPVALAAAFEAEVVFDDFAEADTEAVAAAALVVLEEEAAALVAADDLVVLEEVAAALEAADVLVVLEEEVAALETADVLAAALVEEVAALLLVTADALLPVLLEVDG